MTTAQALRKSLANTFVLYAKVHSFHWNVTGARFQELHSFFEDLYTGLWKNVDEIAELLRISGEEAPKTLSEMTSGATIEELPQTPSGEEMLKRVEKDIETLIATYTVGANAADEEDNIGCEAFFGDLIEKYQKVLWMVKSMQS